jgi:hypothetical protein
MPAAYEKYRDQLIAKGTPVKEAKRRAAIWYNTTFKNRTPVTRNYEKTLRKRRAMKRKGAHGK